MPILEKSPPNDIGQGVRITMKYDWEEGIEKIFDFEDINNTLDELTDRHRPIDFNPRVIGIIMANTFDNEACLVVNPWRR